eukprot:4892511-Amphidinium_carterae.1
MMTMRMRMIMKMIPSSENSNDNNVQYEDVRVPQQFLRGGRWFGCRSPSAPSSDKLPVAEETREVRRADARMED